MRAYVIERILLYICTEKGVRWQMLNGEKLAKIQLLKTSVNGFRKENTEP